jgi:hypothetical protein
LVLSTTELFNLLEYYVSVHYQSPSSPQRSETKTSSESLPSSATIPFTPALLLNSIEPDAKEGRDWIEKLLRSCSTEGEQLWHTVAENGASGGYAEYLTRYAADSFKLYPLGRVKNELGAHPSVKMMNELITEKRIDSTWQAWVSPIPYVIGRNVDLAEVEFISIDPDTPVNTANGHDEKQHLSISSTAPKRKLKVGRVYGFRNIQTIISKFKRNKMDLDVIEVMACPSGCVNGGGQIKVTASSNEKETDKDAKLRIERVNDLIHSRKVLRLEESPLIRYLYGSHSPHVTPQRQQQQQQQHGDFSDSNTTTPSIVLNRNELFHTRYHALPKLEQIAPLATKW